VLLEGAVADEGLATLCVSNGVTSSDTRVKDLVDMVAMMAIEHIMGDVLLASLRATFDLRATHPLPASFPDAPTAWAMPFTQLAGHTPTAPTTDLVEAVAQTGQFWDRSSVPGYLAGTGCPSAASGSPHRRAAARLPWLPPGEKQRRL
jgi:hypothetical protein